MCQQPRLGLRRKCVPQLSNFLCNWGDGPLKTKMLQKHILGRIKCFHLGVTECLDSNTIGPIFFFLKTDPLTKEEAIWKCAVNISYFQIKHLVILNLFFSSSLLLVPVRLQCSLQTESRAGGLCLPISRVGGPEKAMAPHSSTLAWKNPMGGGAW